MTTVRKRGRLIGEPPYRSKQQSTGTNENPQKTIGNGVAAVSSYPLSIDKNSSINHQFYCSRIAKDKNDAITTYKNLVKNHAKLLEEKKDHYAYVIERARIKIPDQSLQKYIIGLRSIMSGYQDVPGLAAPWCRVMEYPWWFGM
jgi:pyruvate formate-lyase activating enzyme-like uncharacterized protein